MVIKRESFDLRSKVALGRIQFKPPFKANSSMQDEARFVYVKNGKSRLNAPQARYELSTGDCLLMSCDQFVNTWLENEDDSTNELTIFHFYPDILKYVYNDQLPDFFDKKGGQQLNRVEKFPSNEMILHFIHSLDYYFNNSSFITEELLKVKIQELVLILINTDSSGRMQSILSGLFRSPEYEFKEIINSNLYEDLNLEDLAFFAGLSLSSFKRKFKSIYGTSPNRYIKGKRLEKAKSLLEKEELRISEIAYDCGFNDIGYFSKSFHTMYACSPSDYRKSILSS